MSLLMSNMNNELSRKLTYYSSTNKSNNFNYNFIHNCVNHLALLQELVQDFYTKDAKDAEKSIVILLSADILYDDLLISNILDMYFNSFQLVN